MSTKVTFSKEQLHYLRLLSKQYPTVQDAGSEIIKLRAVLNLPKGTEHFMSDIHGEYEAFLHIMNSGSGEIREKLQELFAGVMLQQDINDLATLIYYPKAKMAMVYDSQENMDEWYYITLQRLVQVCRYVSHKHTRSKVRSYIPEGYKDVIDDELVAMIESHLGRKRFKGYKLESIDIQLIGRPTKKKYTV